MSKPRPILHRQRSSKANPQPFGVSVRKAGRRVLVSPITPSAGSIGMEAPDLPGVIQGIQANQYEWRLGSALNTVGMPFQFQVSVFGGRAVRGGQVIDFLAMTAPLPTPLFADGEHWHEGALAKDDQYKRADLEWAMKDLWNPPISFFGPELHSIESAIEAVRRKLL